MTAMSPSTSIPSDDETPDLIDSIDFWFEKAVPDPQLRNFTTQTGVHFEEFGEMLEAMLPALTDPEQKRRFNDFLGMAKAWAARFKAGTVQFNPELMNPVSLLDALCDQIVTSVGVAHMGRMDIYGALNEVDLSNWSKFDPEGNPIFDENRKIIKGPAYKKAELSRFV